MTPADQCPEDVRKAVNRIWGLALEVSLLNPSNEHSAKTHAALTKLSEELRAAGFIAAAVQYAK